MKSLAGKSLFITGGAGFIGANLLRRLLMQDVKRVTVYDNLSTGKLWHLQGYAGDGRLNVVVGDVRDLVALKKAIAGHDLVIHLAANSDIARAAEHPLIDFEEGTLLTQNVLEAMRETGVKRILFTSGSGVYGDVPPEPIPENYPHMRPISTYGAQKLAGEALISAYSHMFGMMGSVTRFANVVGPLMTHGVTHDFIRRLRLDRRCLKILGDGQQTKPYIHIDDIIDALFLIIERQTGGYDCYNVATTDSLTVSEIADLLVEMMGLNEVVYEFTGGSRGWRADVPTYSLDSSHIRKLGWKNKMNSRAAVIAAARTMLEELALEKNNT